MPALGRPSQPASHAPSRHHGPEWEGREKLRERKRGPRLTGFKGSMAAASSPAPGHAPPAAAICRERREKGEEITVCLVGERHQPGRSGPVSAVVWIEEQRVGLAPKGNIPSRCGFTPSSENWRTEPTRSRPCLFRPFRQHPPPPAAPPATSSRTTRRAQQGAAELGPQRGAPART